MESIHPEYPRAQRILARRDPVLKKLIRQIGPCTLRTSDDHFGVLARSIVAQQISSKAAKAITARLEEALRPKGIHPQAILQADDDTLRAAGLSTAKRTYLRDLAEKVNAKEVVLGRALHDLTDEAIIAQLMPVKGIGRWTAEMFLIFGLGRLDVLPVADFGLRAGVRREYELPDLPKANELIELGEPWRPYRSVATWYFWRSFGNVPQS